MLFKGKEIDTVRVALKYDNKSEIELLRSGFIKQRVFIGYLEKPSATSNLLIYDVFFNVGATEIAIAKCWDINKRNSFMVILVFSYSDCQKSDFINLGMDVREVYVKRTVIPSSINSKKTGEMNLLFYVMTNIPGQFTTTNSFEPEDQNPS